jgi:predicted Zn-dependent peptidase
MSEAPESADDIDFEHLTPEEVADLRQQIIDARRKHAEDQRELAELRIRLEALELRTPHRQPPVVD